MYPALHELGHSLATLMFGGKVIEFHLLPLPNMLCDGSSVGNARLVIIGICGMLIPFLISISFKPKHFTLWYVMQLIKGISSLAFAIVNKFNVRDNFFYIGHLYDYNYINFNFLSDFFYIHLETYR